MIQLIVYTGFYWAVKVMESLLVVNSATACALPLPWISTLRGLGAGAKRQGWAQTADAHNLWPWWVSCSLKNHTVPRWGSVPNCGVPLLIKLRGKERGKAVRASMLAPAHILLDRHAEGGRARRLLEEEEECDGRKKRQRWRWNCDGYNLEIIHIASDFSL